MFGQSSQSTGIFGNTPSAPSTTGGFGHQRSNTSLFTPAAGTTTSTTTAPFSFNTSSAPNASSTPATGTPSLFGSTTTTAPATQGTSFSFGNTTTTQQPQTQSLFGATANKPATTSFSFGNPTANTQTQQKPLFGSTTTTPSLFGSTATTTPSLFGSTQQQQQQQQQPSSLFGPSQQQQQQQQGSSLLSLQAAFPDTNVPYFTIRPDGISRTSFPSNFFVEETSSSSNNNNNNNNNYKTVNTFIYKGKETTIDAPSLKRQEQPESATTTAPIAPTTATTTTSSKHPLSTSTPSRAFGEKRKVLPGFLTGTSAQSSESAITGQKRFSDSNDSNNRRLLFKSTSSPASSSGIFGGQQDDAHTGFGKRRTTDINLDQPPVSSLWDVGVNPRPAIMSANLNDMKKTITMTSGMNEHGIKSGTSTAVSIFGFPNNLTAQVLDYFTALGEIAEKELSDGGNWMIIRYAKEESAKKALAYNGKVLNGHYMVGVTPLISALATTENNTTTTSTSVGTTQPPHLRSTPVVLTQPTQGVFKINDTNNNKPVSSGLFGFFTKFASPSTITSSSLPASSSSSSSSSSSAPSSFTSLEPTSSSLSTTSSTSSQFTNERGQQVTKVVDDSYATWIKNQLRF